MQVHIFKGRDRIFACTNDATGANLPSQFAPWKAFKSIEVTKGVPTPGLDTDECIDDIDRYGVHVTDAHVRITETALSLK